MQEKFCISKMSASAMAPVKFSGFDPEIVSQATDAVMKYVIDYYFEDRDLPPFDLDIIHQEIIDLITDNPDPKGGQLSTMATKHFFLIFVPPVLRHSDVEQIIVKDTRDQIHLILSKFRLTWNWETFSNFSGTEKFWM
jgi:hypothetical protein